MLAHRSPAGIGRDWRWNEFPETYDAAPDAAHSSSRCHNAERSIYMAQQCTHLDQIHEVTLSADGCEECLKMGDTWVHLRLCLICGHVGCCDSSKNKHASKHFHAVGHPLVRSFERGEDWMWCYEDRVMMASPR